MKVSCRVIKKWRDPMQFDMPAGDFVFNVFGRRFIPHVKIPLYTEAFAAFGITDTAPEPLFGTFIGNNHEDGVSVHEHTDPAPDGFAHVRCNWMLKKPTVGGDPVLDGEVVPVQEGDLWLCIASHERHATTAIYGGERLICSFGALVECGNLQHLANLGA